MNWLTEFRLGLMTVAISAGYGLGSPGRDPMATFGFIVGLGIMIDGFVRGTTEEEQ